MMEVLSTTSTTSTNLFCQSIIKEQGKDDNMGIIMLESMDFEKRPLHTANIPCRNAGTNRRGKVLSITPPAESNYNSCHECTTTYTEDLTYLEGPVPVPVPPAAGGGSGDAVLPTADDYANLFFCEPSEEEELRASLAQEERLDDSPRACTPPSTTGVGAASSTSSSSSSSRRKSKKRRRVSFGASIPTFHHLDDVPPAHAMTPDERSAQWFSRGDLDGLKSLAQVSIKDMRGRVLGKKAHEYKDRSKFRSMMLALERETDSSIRGLEHRVLRRKQTRQMLIRDVLECQKHVLGLARFGHEMDPKERSMLLAKVSKERSVNARTAAFVNAKYDYEEIYYAGDGMADEAVDTRMRKRQKQARQVSLEKIA